MISLCSPTRNSDASNQILISVTQPVSSSAVVASITVTEAVPFSSVVLPSVSTVLSTKLLPSAGEALVDHLDIPEPDFSSAAVPSTLAPLPSSASSGAPAFIVRSAAVQDEDSDSESQGGETDPPTKRKHVSRL